MYCHDVPQRACRPKIGNHRHDYHTDDEKSEDEEAEEGDGTEKEDDDEGDDETGLDEAKVSDESIVSRAVHRGLSECVLLYGPFLGHMVIWWGASSSWALACGTQGESTEGESSDNAAMADANNPNEPPMPNLLGGGGEWPDRWLLDDGCVRGQPQHACSGMHAPTCLQAMIS